MKKELLLITLLPLLFIGCSSRNMAEPKINLSKPQYVKAMDEKKEDKSNNAGSIFGQGYNPLFSDIKAMKINDVVIVRIQEDVTLTSDRSKKINRTGEVNLGGGIIQPGADNKNAAINSLATKINGLTNIGFKSNSATSFDGKGQASIKEQFTATIASRITKVLSNGNYYIEGSRELLINGDKQLVRIAGVIRPYDISQDNTIDSSYISDAKIFYTTEGEFQRATDRGWGSKALESLWPF